LKKRKKKFFSLYFFLEFKINSKASKILVLILTKMPQIKQHIQRRSISTIDNSSDMAFIT